LRQKGTRIRSDGTAAAIGEKQGRGSGNVVNKTYLEYMIVR
jgi:hypothetical protein